MANTNNNFSDYLKFYLFTPGRPKTLINDLIGWEDYGLDAKRNRTYHGTLITVTKELGFKGDAKKMIEEVYDEKGVIGDLRLIRERLVDSDGELTTYEEDPVYADFYTLKRIDDIVYLNFYSNSLQTLIDAHEDDDFEIERETDIKGNTIDPMPESFIELRGRSLQSIGSHKLLRSIVGADRPGTWPTIIISEGPSRHHEADRKQIAPVLDMNGTGLFYDRRATDENEPDKTVSLDYDFDITFGNNTFDTPTTKVQFGITKWTYDVPTATYVIVSTTIIHETQPLAGQETESIHLSGTLSFEVTRFEGLSYYVGQTNQSVPFYIVFNSSKVTLYEVAYFEPSRAKYAFLYDVINRLSYIITGSNNKFVSNYLGRTEVGYPSDGEGGLIGLLSGLWARGFTKDFDNYKSLKVSLKDTLESAANCFNLGYGVETINNEEKLVVEDIKYFYRDDFAGAFPQPINNIEVMIEQSLFYSGLEIGYEKSGGLNQEMGLDEPNNKTQYTTPIDNTQNKFSKKIKFRADEYKLEELRRKTAEKFPNESSGEEEDIWLLDLTRSTDIDNPIRQIHWSDRLSSAPTGIHDPDSFRSFFFTPATILRRLAKNFLSGIALYKNDFINFISGSSNVKLGLSYINETPYTENENVRVGDLDYPIFGTQIIKFTHPYSKEVEDLIFGKKEVVINGQSRKIPNYYFKYRFVDSQDRVYIGYFLSYEYTDNPTFEFLLSNDKII